MMVYTWGDSVRVRDEAPRAYRPGSLAEIVGVRDGGSTADALASVYIIEFEDGESVEVEGEWLEPPRSEGNLMRSLKPVRVVFPSTASGFDRWSYKAKWNHSNRPQGSPFAACALGRLQVHDQLPRSAF